MDEEVVARVQEIIEDSLTKISFEKVGKDLLKDVTRKLSDSDLQTVAEALTEQLDIKLKS